MSEAPERIWLQLGAGDYGTHTWCDQPQDWADENGEGEPEYIRVDLHDAAIAELKAKLAKAVELLNHWRLAAAGHVSVQSAIDKHDTNLAELKGPHQ